MGVLGDGIVIVLNFQDDVFGVYNLEVDNGVDADGEVIFGDDFLFGDIGGGDSHIDLDHPLDNGDNYL